MDQKADPLNCPCDGEAPGPGISSATTCAPRMKRPLGGIRHHLAAPHVALRIDRARFLEIGSAPK